MVQRHSERDVQVVSLLSTLDEALEIVKGYSDVDGQTALPTQNPGSLLEQCLGLCAQANAIGPEPVRLLHQFACTGGTLIAKCLAAMPNVQLLSEVDPLSTLLLGQARPHFAPTDLIVQMRQSTRGAAQALLVRIFLDGIGLVHENCADRGLRLLLRDHAHSHYCTGPEIPQRPSLRRIMADRFELLSAVTVRHPLDSYLSLRSNGWISFEPVGLDEYCRRYLRFLDDHQGLAVFRYEDFVQAPETQMQLLCDVLRLPYAAEFGQRFSVFRLTGDSGRSGSVIAARPPRDPDDPGVEREAAQSLHYRTLLGRLGYAPERSGIRSDTGG